MILFESGRLKECFFRRPEELNHQTEIILV